MTKFQRLSSQRKLATSLFAQGRAPEGRLILERIVDELLRPLAPKTKGK